MSGIAVSNLLGRAMTWTEFHRPWAYDYACGACKKGLRIWDGLEKVGLQICRNLRVFRRYIMQDCADVAASFLAGATKKFFVVANSGSMCSSGN
jgi:hypothetical protein